MNPSRESSAGGMGMRNRIAATLAIVLMSAAAEDPGVLLWRETFDRFTSDLPYNQSTGMTLSAFVETTDVSGAWEGAYLFPYKYADSQIRIGTTSNPGWLMTPPLDVSGDRLRLHFTAWRQAENEEEIGSPTKPAAYEVSAVSAAQTNLLGSVVLTLASSTAVLDLPGFASGDRVLFKSSTVAAAYRLVLDDVSIYEAPPPPPPAVVDGVVQLRDDPYGEDFSCLAQLTGLTAWTNGTTVGGWQAFKNAEACESVRPNAGTTTTGGLYAFHSGDDLASYSLGTPGHGRQRVRLRRRVPQCGVRRVDGFRVLLRLPAVERPQGRQDDLSEYLVTNAPATVMAEGDCKTLDGAAYTTVAASETETFPLGASVADIRIPVSLPEASYLLVRWRDPKIASSCPIAVDNVRLAFRRQSEATVLLFR
ncbi:MAG: hypothetical protein ACI4Q3_06395 [Kiritimatiellia bacterium]